MGNFYLYVMYKRTIIIRYLYIYFLSVNECKEFDINKYSTLRITKDVYNLSDRTPFNIIIPNNTNLIDDHF